MNFRNRIMLLFDEISDEIYRIGINGDNVTRVIMYKGKTAHRACIP